MKALVLYGRVGLLLVLLTACSSGPDVMQVKIQNDTPSTVVVKQCDVQCDQIHETHQLIPNQSVTVNTSTGGVNNYWLVIGTNGKLEGCLNLFYTHSEGGVTKRVSEMSSCPPGTPDATSGR